MDDIVNLIGVVAPEFLDSDPANVTRNLTFAQFAIDETSKSVFGAVYIRAMAYLAAHMLSRSLADAGASAGGVPGGGVGGHTGLIASVKIGDESIGYGGGGASFGVSPGNGVSAGDSVLATTRFGLEYMRLRNQRPTVGAFLV